MNEMTLGTRQGLGTYFRETGGEKENRPQIALSTIKLKYIMKIFKMKKINYLNLENLSKIILNMQVKTLVKKLEKFIMIRVIKRQFMEQQLKMKEKNWRKKVQIYFLFLGLAKTINFLNYLQYNLQTNYQIFSIYLKLD